MYMFSKQVGIKDSKEADCPFYSYFTTPCFIVESDLANAISWVKSLKGPWKMQFLFNEISSLLSDLQVSFQHVSKYADGMADCLAKHGVDQSCNLSASLV